MPACFFVMGVDEAAVNTREDVEARFRNERRQCGAGGIEAQNRTPKSGVAKRRTCG